MKYRLMVYLVSCSFLLSCSNVAHQPTTMQTMQKELRQGMQQDYYLQSQTRKVPSAIQATLASPSKSRMQIEAHHFDVSVKNVPAKSFFMGLVVNTPYSMVVSPDVKGTISLQLKHVTLDEVMDTVRRIYGYEYERTPYGYIILPHQLMTKTFSINYLDVLRSGQTQTSTTSGQISEKVQSGGNTSTISNNNSTNTNNDAEATTYNSRVTTRSQMEFWKELKATLQTITNDDKTQSVNVIPSAGLVIVKAYPNAMRDVANYLEQLQSRISKQVILEAKILEVELKDGYQAGIDWAAFNRNALQRGAGISNFLNQTVENVNGTTTLSKNLPDLSDTDIDQPFAGIFTAQIRGDFKAAIELLSTQGNVQVLSSPRISTMNNQKAVIKVGSDEFFVTGVSTNNTIVGGNLVPDQDIELTPFFSGINLDVTPQISVNGVVTLHIHPSVSNVRDQTKNLTLSGQNFTLPLALSEVRETDTIVRALNGQVVVIGGLMQTRMVEQIAETPVLGKIPMVGTLFRHTKQNAVKSELVILLKPIVIDHQGRRWTQQLAQEQQRFQALNRGFHVSDKSSIFGTAGE